jgi:acetolactate synthase-1/2/3 large subunit
MREVGRILAAAQRPFVILGGSGWTRDSVVAMRAFLEKHNLSAGASFRCQDLLDNRSPSYAGHVGIGVDPDLAQRIKDADVVMVIGARLGEMTTSAYTLFEVPVPRQTLIHVHAGAEELGRVYQGAVLVNSGYPQFVDALGGLQLDGAKWREGTGAARKNYLAYCEPKALPGRVQYGEIVKGLRETLPADAVICNGAGNFATWVHRYYQYRDFRTQLAPTNGSMGYGVPAAIAAKIAQPHRTVVAFAGDGDFLMNGQELATAMQYGANVIIVVVNNGMYGTIRMHQEREYPARVSGTELQNPDFAALARAYGAFGEAVETTEAFAPALARAMAAGKPALIELRLDPEALTPTMTLSAIRAQAQKKS